MAAQTADELMCEYYEAPLPPPACPVALTRPLTDLMPPQGVRTVGSSMTLNVRSWGPWSRFQTPSS